MTQTLLFVLLGLGAGIMSGVVGIGGGVILVPALTFLFGMTAHQAQGTTLAIMVPPIGILAALTYYKQGYVDLKVALFVALGFILGGLLGAKLAVTLSSATLTRIFGGVITLIGLKMLLT